MPVPLPAADALSGLTRRARRAAESADLIYLVCPAGFPNFGDELIAEAWLRWLARHRPLATVVVDCPRPGPAALLLRRAHRRAIFVNTLWELTAHAHSEHAGADVDRDRPWEWVAHAASRFGPAPREGHGIDLLLRAGTVHLLGGGYVNAVWPQHLSLVAAVAELARTTGARAVATGMGLLPVLDGEAGDRFLSDAAAFAVFNVRDEPSAEYTAALPGASFTGDDAWLSPRLPRPGTPAASGKVVLCAQSDLTEDFRYGADTGIEALAGFLRATLDAWQVPGEQVIVVEAIPGLDMKVPDLLGDRLAGAQRISFLDVWENGLPAGRGHTWLSTRFHPHLLAAAAGDSGVAIVPKPDYYGTKHASLSALGSAWTVADGTAIPERPTAGGFPAATVTAAAGRTRALADRLYPAGARLRRASAR